MNIIKYFISTTERHQYTQFFNFKSTKVNLLSCLNLFVGQDDEFCVMIGQIACQSRSLRTVNYYFNKKQQNVCLKRCNGWCSDTTNFYKWNCKIITVNSPLVEQILQTNKDVSIVPLCSKHFPGKSTKAHIYSLSSYSLKHWFFFPSNMKHL